MNPPKPSTVHILLVDDERLSRVVVANLLRKCSYKVTVAEGGSEALQLLQDKPPGTFHLVLTDVMMPQVGGLDLLRYVRSHKHLSDLPVVMMSASEQAEMMYTCIRGGAEEYLIKPVTQKEVQNIWTHVIKRLSLAMDAATQRALEEAASCEEQVSRPSLNPWPQQDRASASADFLCPFDFTAT
ncbi:CheY-like superfamily [Haematococcus lacustris]